MTTTMTPALRKSAEEVLMERWERELRSLGLARKVREQTAKIKKMTDREIWSALKNGA